MSLFIFQKILISLYMDKDVRDAFSCNPDLLFAKDALSNREKQTLCAIAKNHLDLFAHSLSNKKRHVAEKILFRNPRVALISLWYVSGPVIFSLAKDSQHIRIIKIDHPQFTILKTINKEITIGNIIRRCMLLEELRLNDILKTARLMHAENMWGIRLRMY